MARQATMQLIHRIRKRGLSEATGPSAMYCSLVIRDSTGAAPEL
jgi:hypothetical protein